LPLLTPKNPYHRNHFFFSPFTKPATMTIKMMAVRLIRLDSLWEQTGVVAFKKANNWSGVGVSDPSETEGHQAGPHIIPIVPTPEEALKRGPPPHSFPSGYVSNRIPLRDKEPPGRVSDRRFSAHKQALLAICPWWKGVCCIWMKGGSSPSQLMVVSQGPA